MNVKTVLFQAIRFSISTQFSSIWPIDRTLSSATTPGYSGPGSDGNERILFIPQSSIITGTSPSDCLVSYAGHSLGGGYPSTEKQYVYSTASADWAIWNKGLRKYEFDLISTMLLGRTYLGPLAPSSGAVEYTDCISEEE